MPVLVTGATGFVGRALIAALLEQGGQVRAFVRRDDAELRAAGVHLAVGSFDELQHLEAALTQVHTIVHLVGGWWPEDGVTFDYLNRDTTETAVIAARAADVKRFVFLSFPGADPASTNEFLAAKGRAEQHIATSGMEYVILRCAPVTRRTETGAVQPETYNHETFVETLRRMGGFPGSGDQKINPIALHDVVSALLAADARESAFSGTWELGGGETISMAEFATRAGIPKRKPKRGTPKALIDVLARDVIADPKEALEHLGLRAP